MAVEIVYIPYRGFRGTAEIRGETIGVQTMNDECYCNLSIMQKVLRILFLN